MGEKITFKKSSQDEELNQYTMPHFRQVCAYFNDHHMPEKFKDYAERILDFDVKDDDIFVISVPKCGTTWMQELIWCVTNNCDLEKAKNATLSQRFCFLEASMLSGFGDMPSTSGIEDSVTRTINKKGRRFIKSHLPSSLLPKQLIERKTKAKTVYVIRDPRDVCLSAYYHQKRCSGFTGDISSFVKLFINDKVNYQPFWKHVLDFWFLRNSPFVLIVKYEEMKEDLPAVIRRVADFLDTKLTYDQLSTLTDHLSFSSMKENSAVNYTENDELFSKLGCERIPFLRSGKVGGHKAEMSKEDANLLDEWVRKNLAGKEDVFPFYHPDSDTL